jgi:hypothetical protein
MEQFEPVIVAFCCHYCAYTAADMAGSQRLPYPANVKIIRVPCSGKVDALHLTKPLKKALMESMSRAAWRVTVTLKTATKGCQKGCLCPEIS